MASLFWLSLALVVYAYIGYPLVLYLLSRFGDRGRHLPSESSCRTVTVVIAAFNERAYIEEKIRNALSVDYPANFLRVIVVSDGSDDGTSELAADMQDPRLTLKILPARGGKANALNVAIDGLDTEIAVFTDANVMMESAAVRNLVARFSDSRCGCVTGRVELLSMTSGEPLGEGAYMRFERIVQRLESMAGSTVSVDGAMFAVRSSLLKRIPRGLILDDLFLAMTVAGSGYSIEFEPQAVAYERVPAEVKQEFRRKVRIAAGGFQLLPYLDFLRRPLRYPWLWFAFFSHKILRWLSPGLLILLLVSNLSVVADGSAYQVTLVGQIFCYGMAIVGALSRRSRQFWPIYSAYYFAAMNVAILVGFFRWLSGSQSVTWNRVDR